MGLRMLLVWLFGTLLLCAYKVDAKAVFAHFMVGNTASFSVNDWKNDISVAQAAHIDAFALNIAYGDSTNGPQLANAFTAADNLGFRMFFSFDYAGNGPWPKDEVISLINQYNSRPSYFRQGSQPLVSTFEGPENAKDWIEIKEQTGCFFVPSWSSLGAKIALEQAGGVVDGLFNWAAWPVGASDMNTYVDASYQQFLKSKPYMMPVSPWFYTNLPGYDKNWLWRGDDLWYDRWQEVQFVQPEWVEIISWNDYGESHYIGPLRDSEYAAFDIGKAPYNYVQNMPHDGWRLFLPFVIDMYKSNKTSITREGLVSWYRLQPVATCTSGGTTGNTASHLQIEHEPVDIVQDKVFYSALLASDASVTVSIGGASVPGSWDDKPAGGRGIYHGSVPFNGHTGQVVVTISRSGSTVAQMTGQSITTSCTSGIANYNPWVGSATASQDIAAASIDASQHVCTRGTGVKNFKGLCEYTCSLGYCPIGACTCTATGPQPKLPTPQNVTGYPITGEDANYSGLCAFACNYDYCPPTACGLVEVPLTVSTHSPFTPDACVSGSGSGNLAGLCSFSCNYGFCPMHSCTCTGTGYLVDLPTAKNIVCNPAPGMDPLLYKGLCQFAGKYGYCPDGACQTSGSNQPSSPVVSVEPSRSPTTFSTLPSKPSATPMPTPLPPPPSDPQPPPKPKPGNPCRNNEIGVGTDQSCGIGDPRSGPDCGATIGALFQHDCKKMLDTTYEEDPCDGGFAKGNSVSCKSGNVTAVTFKGTKYGSCYQPEAGASTNNCLGTTGFSSTYNIISWCCVPV